MILYINVVIEFNAKMVHLFNSRVILFQLGFMYYLSIVVNGYIQDQMFNLHTGLMRNYKTNMLPRNDRHPINVNITFYLMALLRFDEIEETLVSIAWLSVSWKDQYLMWSENSEYDNITEIYLKESEIWKPDILLLNTVEGYQSLGSGDRLLSIESDGIVTWEPGHRFATACNLQISKYPFDSQQCSFKFETWTHYDEVVRLTSVSDEIILDDFQENGEWEIISSSAESGIVQVEGYGMPEYTVTISFQRRRMYYVLTICVPIIVLSALNCFVHLLPPDSGEKISFCLTILLAYMVYISFLSDNLPRTSKTTSYMVIYLSLMICLSSISVLSSVIVLVFWHKSDETANGNEFYKANEAKNGKLTEFIFQHKDSAESYLVNGEVRSAERLKRRNSESNKKMIAKWIDLIMFISVSTVTLAATVVVIVLLLQT